MEERELTDAGNKPAPHHVDGLHILIQAASVVGDNRQLHTGWLICIRNGCLFLGVRLVFLVFKQSMSFR